MFICGSGDLVTVIVRKVAASSLSLIYSEWQDIFGQSRIDKCYTDSFVVVIVGTSDRRICRSTSIRTMSVLHSRAGSPHMGTLNSHFNSAASSGSVTLDRMHRGDFAAYSPNLSSLATRNPTYTGFDGQSYRLPQPVNEQWSLSRNGPRPTASNHRGISLTYHWQDCSVESRLIAVMCYILDSTVYLQCRQKVYLYHLSLWCTLMIG